MGPTLRVMPRETAKTVGGQVSSGQRGKSRMRVLYSGALAIFVAISSLAQTQSTAKQHGDREKLIGAWRLAHIDSPGPDGKPSDIPQPKGMLIYTRDGHMSVQLMYPKSANAQSNQYVLDGYEASFGSYEVDEVTHTLTHHVQGSVTRERLVGKDLPRVYELTTDGRLIIKSARPDEHWSVTWEHY
jgi:lipocalin-like protein